MSESNNNSGLIAVIAVVLIGIFSLLVYQANQKTPEEKIADSVSQVADDVSSAVSGE